MLWALRLISAIVVSGGLLGLFFYDYVTPRSGVTGNLGSPSTEDAFVKNVQNGEGSDPVASEWRQARGDHKIIAYAIANCKQFHEKFASPTECRESFSACSCWI